MTSRRAHGEGSIHRRKDFRWAATIGLGYSGGRRLRKTFYGKTQAEVLSKLVTARKQVQDGLAPPPEKQTVGGFLEAWLDDAGARVRPRTLVSYTGIVQLHLIPDLGHVRLARLTPGQVQDLLVAKAQSGLSPRTVQYIRAVLRQALNRALRWGMVARNVATLVDAPLAPRRPLDPLTAMQARALMEGVKGHRLEGVVAVALGGGLRQGEILALTWADLNLDQGTLRIQASLQRLAGRLERVEPKTALSRRTVSLPASVVSVLRRHRATQLEERLAAGPAWHDGDLVFATHQGRPLDGRNVTQWFQRELEGLGLPRQRFHDLRHACASFLLAQGTNPRVVMEILGHSDVRTTLGTYSHVSRPLLGEAAEKLDLILRPAAGGQ